MREATAADVTRTDVARLYDAIGSAFDAKRSRPWDAVVDFVEERASGALALDLGCGNGRHLPALADRFERVLAMDLSRGMLEIARANAAREGIDASLACVQGDASDIPVAGATVDALVYVAALHHLPSPELRLRSLREIDRVLTGDGVGLIGVWAIDHDYFDGSRELIRANDHDVYVPWQAADGVRDRYYHVYDEAGFRDLLSRSPLDVERVALIDGNYYAVVRGA